MRMISRCLDLEMQDSKPQLSWNSRKFVIFCLVDTIIRIEIMLSKSCTEHDILYVCSVCSFVYVMSVYVFTGLDAWHVAAAFAKALSPLSHFDGRWTRTMISSSAHWHAYITEPHSTNTFRGFDRTICPSAVAHCCEWQSGGMQIMSFLAPFPEIHQFPKQVIFCASIAATCLPRFLLAMYIVY